MTSLSERLREMSVPPACSRCGMVSPGIAVGNGATFAVALRTVALDAVIDTIQPKDADELRGALLLADEIARWLLGEESPPAPAAESDAKYAGNYSGGPADPARAVDGSPPGSGSVAPAGATPGPELGPSRPGERLVPRRPEDETAVLPRAADVAPEPPAVADPAPPIADPAPAVDELSANEAAVLAAIRRAGEADGVCRLVARELARAAGIPAGSIGGVLTRLAARGLVLRESAPGEPLALRLPDEDEDDEPPRAPAGETPAQRVARERRELDEARRRGEITLADRERPIFQRAGDR